MIERCNSARYCHRVAIRCACRAHETHQQWVENPGPGAGRERQLQVIKLRGESAVFVSDRNFLVFQHPTVLIAKHREQHLVSEVVLWRMPIDVEEGGVR